MQRHSHLLLAIAVAPLLQAQYAPPDGSALQNVIVERYYIADANDAADTDGGPGLVEGATTYRVFIDLKAGYKLLTIGGFENHPIMMAASTSFFNNEDRGEAWGYSINDIHLDVNTVAIDSWLTIGAASDAHWGVLKTADPDGNAGVLFPNDGGSTGTPLLANDAASMGLPLDQADGIWSATPVPGVNAVGTAPDLFDPGGSNAYTSENYAWAVLGGISAPDTNNRILVGQFTTDGVLSYCLNLFVKIPDSLVCNDPACHNFLIYYANLLPSDTSGTSIANDNIFTHPALCYDSSVQQADCEGIVGGTALPGTACDDGNADTTNDAYAATCDCLGEDCDGVPGGPALPGAPCDDGNAATTNDTWIAGCICEGTVGIEELPDEKISIAPNPTHDLITVNIAGANGARIRYELIDPLGAVVIARELGARHADARSTIDLSPLSQGTYFLHVFVGEAKHVRRIVKL